MPVSDGKTFFSSIQGGTTIASIDPANQSLTLSQTANYGGSDNLIFQFTVPQFVADQYTLVPSTLTSVTPTGPTPL